MIQNVGTVVKKNDERKEKKKTNMNEISHFLPFFDALDHSGLYVQCICTMHPSASLSDVTIAYTIQEEKMKFTLR